MISHRDSEGRYFVLETRKRDWSKDPQGARPLYGGMAGSGDYLSIAVRSAPTLLICAHGNPLAGLDAKAGILPCWAGGISGDARFYLTRQ